MNLKHIINRSKAIILKPEIEWQTIAEETSNIKDVFINFVLPYLILGFISSTIGFFLARYLTLSASVAFALISLIVFVVVLFVSSIIIEALGKSFNTEISRNKAFKLVAYSFTPSYIINIIVGLLPILSILTILGLYSIYIMWVGFGSLLNTPQEKRVGFFIITLLILISEMVLLNFILGAIFVSALGMDGWMILLAK